MTKESLERLKNELEAIRTLLQAWSFVSVEYSSAFVRTDGIPMLYLRARTRAYYLHIEGMIKSGELCFYCKLTQSARNKHGHKDEIIGWDNLYNDRPHIHFDEDKRREWRQQKINWEEIKATVERLEARDDSSS